MACEGHAAKIVEAGRSASTVGGGRSAKIAEGPKFAITAERNACALSVMEPEFAITGGRKPSAKIAKDQITASMANNDRHARNALTLFARLNHALYGVIDLRVCVPCRGTCRFVTQTTPKLLLRARS